MKKVTLTKDEIRLLDSISFAISKEDKSKVMTGFNQRIEDWKKFVAKVEKEYPLEIYSYSNDITQRESIEELIERTKDLNTKKKVEELMMPIDNRFMEATNKVNKPVLSWGC